MPNKVRERFYLRALLGALDIELEETNFKDWETPDFIAEREHPILGIEFTVFFLPPRNGERPHQEQQSLKNKVVELAERYHSESGGPALYVSVIFNTHYPLNNNRTHSLARELAEAVFSTTVPKSIEDPSENVPWNKRPREITGIRIWGSIDGSDRLWHADAGGWVAQVHESQISDIITSKAQTETTAREVCDELWLVIVNDEFGLSAPAEISESACNAKYECPFDRLLWLRPHEPYAIELQRQ